jgi:uncharacterized coiled-coil protein SlyX
LTEIIATVLRENVISKQPVTQGDLSHGTVDLGHALKRIETQLDHDFGEIRLRLPVPDSGSQPPPRWATPADLGRAKGGDLGEFKGVLEQEREARQWQQTDLSKRIDRLETRLTRGGDTFAELGGQILKHQVQMKTISNRVAVLDDGLRNTRLDLTQVSTRTGASEPRLNQLEQGLATARAAADLAKALEGTVDALDRRLTVQEEWVGPFRNWSHDQVQRHENLLNHHEGWLKHHEEWLGNHNELLKRVFERLQALGTLLNTQPPQMPTQIQPFNAPRGPFNVPRGSFNPPRPAPVPQPKRDRPGGMRGAGPIR